MKRITIWVNEETAEQVERIIKASPISHEALGYQWEIAKRALNEHIEVCTETKCILRDRLQMQLDAIARAKHGCVVTAQLMVQIQEQLEACELPKNLYELSKEL